MFICLGGGAMTATMHTRNRLIAAGCKMLKHTLAAGFLVCTFGLTAVNAEVLETSFFKVDLGTQWKPVGKMQNTPHSVNINLHNDTARSSVNVVVGAAQVEPRELLLQLQKALESQGATVAPIEKQNTWSYFGYNLNGLGGYACSTTDGTNISSIIIMGNPKEGLDLVRSFTDCNEVLFPPL